MRALCMIITTYSTVARVHTVLYTQYTVETVLSSIVAPCDSIVAHDACVHPHPRHVPAAVA